jgi:UrcA family protein
MRNTYLSLLAAGLAIVAGPVPAQDMEVVTVETARKTTVGMSTYGVPIREVVIQSYVSYSDLDLTSTNGVVELENRIRKTAKSSCRQIEVDIPIQGSTEAKCIKDAVDEAMKEAQKAIAVKRSAK